MTKKNPPPNTSSQYSKLWLDYGRSRSSAENDNGSQIRYICSYGESPILHHAKQELIDALSLISGHAIEAHHDASQPGTLVMGSYDEVGQRHQFMADLNRPRLKKGGYLIERDSESSRVFIVADDDSGLLYGAFHLIRMFRTTGNLSRSSIIEEPHWPLRMLNHWDDLNGYIERGYAGQSLWIWDELPETLSPRYRHHARLCASLGINALVLNNVNADPRLLRQDYLEKVKVLADLFRAWGIQIFLSANFGAPLCPSDTPEKMKKWGGVGNLNTADPLSPEVIKWWAEKVDEIYAKIPDFGGFLVKADSEGMPGPKLYERSHTDGANMLARALKPHDGLLIWRAFVYGASEDRACDAYREFTPLDGSFEENVILQVKNGPLDFQPREPFNALFGSMRETPLCLEFQIAKEYLGHASTLAYLGSYWSEVLSTDTYAHGKGSTVASMIDSSTRGQTPGCIAGVANTGDQADWCGNVFNQANWYAFGRLAWSPELEPKRIAEEWVQMTFGTDMATQEKVVGLLMNSYDHHLNYSSPLGLNFLHDWNHYDPKPEMRSSYHGANESGLGIDRTSGGSKALEQYSEELQDTWGDPAKVPLGLLLWFHHISWDHKLPSGKSLWDELQARYEDGVKSVRKMQDDWHSMKNVLHPDLYDSVEKALEREIELSERWSTDCLNYFSRFLASP